MSIEKGTADHNNSGFPVQGQVRGITEVWARCVLCAVCHTCMCRVYCNIYFVENNRPPVQTKQLGSNFGFEDASSGPGRRSFFV